MGDNYIETWEITTLKHGR